MIDSLEILELFVVQKDFTILSALQKIELNERGIIFVLDNYKLIGVLTDGDIRRELIGGTDLQQSCANVCRKDFISASINDSEDEILAKINDQISIIPVLDADKNLIRLVNNYSRDFIQLSQPNLSQSEMKNITECMNSGLISSAGNFVPEFETSFSKYIGAQRSFAVSNGTQALALALWVNEIGPGDEVIVPDLTFAATANAVIQVGATPVLVDVNLQDWNINIELIKGAISDKTKAIIPVHLYGLPCEMKEIMDLAKEFNLIVIEDAAEALGSEYFNQKIGSLGHFSAFSFYANKIITTGEGGMLSINIDFDYDKVLKLRSHGMSLVEKYWHEAWGTNIRLTNLQSAIGVAQLQRIDDFVEHKKRIHKNYLKIFNSLGLDEFIAYRRTEMSFASNSHWLSCFHVDKSKFGGLVNFLNRNSVETRPIFYPLHMQPAFSQYSKFNNKGIWNSQVINEGGICLPSSTTLGISSQERICNLIREFFIKGFSNE
jgi:perosamine synthetase